MAKSTKNGRFTLFSLPVDKFAFMLLFFFFWCVIFTNVPENNRKVAQRRVTMLLKLGLVIFFEWLFCFICRKSLTAINKSNALTKKRKRLGCLSSLRYVCDGNFSHVYMIVASCLLDEKKARELVECSKFAAHISLSWPAKATGQSV